jgi:hypothetical protein
MKYFLVLMFIFSISISNAFASESVGTVLPAFKLSKVCQDVTCTNFGIVNFGPTLNSMTPGATAVTITDTSITGHAWGNQIGWINLSPSGLTSGQVLKVNPNTGVITGLGFANTGSWVNFSPASGGVTINSVGEFVGWAWVSGAYGGWMKFDCSNGATCVKTDWRPIPNRTVVTPPSGGGGGGGGTGTCISNCPAAVTPTPTTLLTPTAPSTRPTTPGTNSNNSGTGNVVNGSQKPPLNTFDPNNTGTPTQGPETVVDTTKNIPAGVTSEVVNGMGDQEEGEYMQTFPKRGYIFKPQKDCFWCIVIRRDFAPTQEVTIGTDGKAIAGGVVIKERRIIKYGFVPKKYEVRFPLSKIGTKAGMQTDPRADLDLTSTGLTLGVLAIIRKLIAVLLIK